MKWRLFRTAIVFVILASAAICSCNAKSSSSSSSKVKKHSVSDPSLTAQAASLSETTNIEEAQSIVTSARKTNEGWLLRYPKSLQYDVTYTYSFEIPADKERPSQGFEQTYRTVYDRGIDFYPPSELCLYKRSSSLPQVLPHSQDDIFRILAYDVKDLPSIPRGLPGPLAAISRNWELSDSLILFPTFGRIKFYILLDAQTGKVLRDVCFAGVSEEGDSAATCTIWDYVYGDNAKFPKTVVLYSFDAISEPEKIGIPASTSDWKRQSDEVLTKADKLCTVSCEVINGLYFAVTYKQEPYGEAKSANVELLRTSISSISVINNTAQVPLWLSRQVSGGRWDYSK